MLLMGGCVCACVPLFIFLCFLPFGCLSFVLPSFLSLCGFSFLLEFVVLSLAVPAKSDREYMTGKIRSTGKDLTNQKAAPGQKVNFPVICNLPDQSEASIPVNRGFNTVLGRLGLNWPIRGSSRSEMYFPGLALVVRPIRKLHSG